MTWLVFLLPAHALDLSTLAEAWEHIESGQAGTDNDDQATGVAFDPSGNVVVSGWLDSTADRGHDGLLIAFDPTGNERWRAIADSGVSGVDVLLSDDRWHGVAIDPTTEDIAVCGQSGGENNNTIWLTELHTADLAAPIWSFPFNDGLDSPNQACTGIALTATNVTSVGWTDGSPEILGQWRALSQGRAQPIVELFWDYDRFAAPGTPDQANSLHIDVGGSLLIAGWVGRAGSVGSVLNDTEATVIKLTSNGNTLWTDEVMGSDSPSLDDRYFGVSSSPVNNHVAAGGWLNVGGDNDGLRDLDGIVRMYDPLGYLALPIFEWNPETVVWDGPGDQGITAVVFDELGGLYVAGFEPAPGGGERWVVAEMLATTGVELSRWEGPAHDGARPAAMAIQGDALVIVGWVDDGNGADVAVLSLALDSDGDGTADVNDGCSDDDDKIDPGVCGCDIPDDDSDGDGVLNCEDGCPADPAKTDPQICGCGFDEDDADKDGAPDCVDLCDSDPSKTEAGVCGCGVPDEDLDDDGYLTCQDQCPDSAPGAIVDGVGCADDSKGTGDTGDTVVVDPKSGCGCQSSSISPVIPLFFAPLISLMRRRPTA